MTCGAPGTVELTGDVALVPVVELEASAFASRPHALPGVTRRADPAAWDARWRASLADAGLHLDPISPGWSLVPLDRLRDPVALLRVVARHLQAPDEDPPLERAALLEQASAFAGGFALVAGGRVVEDLLPRCCGDLSNIEAWVAAAEHASAVPAMLRIGHPWAEVAREGERLLLRSILEDGRPEPGVPAHAIAPAALGAACARAVSDLEGFLPHVEVALRAWLGAAAAQIDPSPAARTLLGLATE